MDAELIKLKIKRYILQYEYVRSEYEETEYMFSIYKAEFYKECPKIIAPKNDAEKADGDKGGGGCGDTGGGCGDGGTTGCRKGEDDGEDKAGKEEESKINIEEGDLECESPGIKFMNKLYRKLSLKTHPDKLNGNNAHFQSVNDAFVAKDVLKLLILAKTFDVEVDYSQAAFIESDMTLFEKAINTVSTKITDIKQTLAWNWAIANDVQKQQYRELYKF
jgi:hypothetical protein